MQVSNNDPRLDSRTDFCLEQIAQNPDITFPNIFRSTSDLVAFYRLINNKQVDYRIILDSLFEQSYSLRPKQGDVLILHDTTEIKPRLDKEMSDFGPIQKSNSSRGFLLHLSLAISDDNSRRILGPCSVYYWTRKQKSSPTNEHRRWFDSVIKATDFFVKDRAIHIMDREGDSYYNLDQLTKNGFRYILRGFHNRLVEQNCKLREYVLKMPIVSNSKAKVSKRVTTILPEKNKIHPGRRERTATLNVSAQKVVLVNSKSIYSKTLSDKIETNIVRVFEPKPPKGEKAIEWILFTSESIDREEDVVKIIKHYKSRWLIEEFFKVLKTGCKIEDRQLKSEHSWYNTLSLFLKIAVDILNLRVIADKPLSQKDPSPYTNINFTVLKKKAKQYRMPLHTISDSLLLIAKLGGHLKNKKYGPGWLVLCRGYEKLLLISEGYALATK